jgi:Sec-independent protein translocase protein TatA
MEIRNVGGPELLLLLFLAGVLLGPRRMVLLGREIGEILRQIKLISRNLTKELNREIDLLDKEMRITLPEGQGEKAESDEVETEASRSSPEQAEAGESEEDSNEDLTSDSRPATQPTEEGEDSKLPEAYLRFIEDFPGEGLESEGPENKGLKNEGLESGGLENEDEGQEGLREETPEKLPSTSTNGAHSD